MAPSLEVEDSAIRVSLETAQRLACEGGFTLRWRPDRTIAFFYPGGTERLDRI